MAIRGQAFEPFFDDLLESWLSLEESSQRAVERRRARQREIHDRPPR
jgi:hypothetical protein